MGSPGRPGRGRRPTPRGGAAAGLHRGGPRPGPAAEDGAVDGLRAAGVPVEPLSGTSVERVEHGVVVGTARVREPDVARVVDALRAAGAGRLPA